MPLHEDLGIEQLRRILAAEPLNADAYRLLASALQGPTRTSSNGVGATTADPGGALVQRAALAVESGDLQKGEVMLRRHLLERPWDAAALSLLAQVAFAYRYELEAESLLRLALECEPALDDARIELARQLNKRDLSLRALNELEPVLQRNPTHVHAMAIKAAALGRLGQYDEAAELYAHILAKAPEEPALWTTYGHLLTTIGKRSDGVAAMRRATKLAPLDGYAWWNLSNVKTFRFRPGEIAEMEAAIRNPGLSAINRAHIHFALGKANEDMERAAEAFAHYVRANEIRQQATPYRADALTKEIDTAVRLFTREFFETRAGVGADNRDPIFIVGMPRSGSTLIEQILSSHPQVEGTRELLHMPAIAKQLGEGTALFSETVLNLSSDRARALGEEYLSRASAHRTGDRPFFTDKLPGNWLRSPLIHLLLPNAKIIDARRHPLPCGFSNFRQNYEKGQTFSFNLSSIGHYYREYVRLMAHVDQILPGCVHRVFHERLIEDTENEVRRLLEYIGLPFDAACLRFYESQRAVRTPSREQVRRPINREGTRQWQKFDEWLQPLKEALGPALDSYPEPPIFDSLPL